MEESNIKNQTLEIKIIVDYFIDILNINAQKMNYSSIFFYFLLILIISKLYSFLLLFYWIIIVLLVQE